MFAVVKKGQQVETKKARTHAPQPLLPVRFTQQASDWWLRKVFGRRLRMSEPPGKEWHHASLHRIGRSTSTLQRKSVIEDPCCRRVMKCRNYNVIYRECTAEKTPVEKWQIETIIVFEMPERFHYTYDRGGNQTKPFYLSYRTLRALNTYWCSSWEYVNTSFYSVPRRGSEAH